MLRKQRKLQPWRRFGYVILIIIKSGELLLWFSPRIINGLRSYIKHSKGCFIRYPNTLKLVKKNSAAPRFLNHFSVFGYRMKHSSSCLIYYLKHAQDVERYQKEIQELKLRERHHDIIFRDVLRHIYHPYGNERCIYYTNWDKEMADGFFFCISRVRS